MSNTNCLEGMACPKCGSEGPFKIVITAWALMFDDGIEETDESEWDDESPCICHECNHLGTVKDFEDETEEPEEEPA